MATYISIPEAYNKIFGERYNKKNAVTYAGIIFLYLLSCILLIFSFMTGFFCLISKYNPNGSNLGVPFIDNLINSLWDQYIGIIIIIGIVSFIIMLFFLVMICGIRLTAIHNSINLKENILPCIKNNFTEIMKNGVMITAGYASLQIISSVLMTALIIPLAAVSTVINSDVLLLIIQYTFYIIIFMFSLLMTLNFAKNCNFTDFFNIIECFELLRRQYKNILLYCLFSALFYTVYYAIILVLIILTAIVLWNSLHTSTEQYPGMYITVGIVLTAIISFLTTVLAMFDIEFMAQIMIIDNKENPNRQLIQKDSNTDNTEEQQ